MRNLTRGPHGTLCSRCWDLNPRNTVFEPKITRELRWLFDRRSDPGGSGFPERPSWLALKGFVTRTSVMNSLPHFTRGSPRTPEWALEVFNTRELSIHPRSTERWFRCWWIRWLCDHPLRLLVPLRVLVLVTGLLRVGVVASAGDLSQEEVTVSQEEEEAAHSSFTHVSQTQQPAERSGMTTPDPD